MHTDTLQTALYWYSDTIFNWDSTIEKHVATTVTIQPIIYLSLQIKI